MGDNNEQIPSPGQNDSVTAHGFLKRCATSFNLINQLSEVQRSAMAAFLSAMMIGLSASLGDPLKDSTSITISIGSAIIRLLPLIAWMTAFVTTFVTWVIIVWPLPQRRYIFPVFVLYFIMCSWTWLMRVGAVQIVCGSGSINGALFASAAIIVIFLTSALFYLWLHIDD